MLPQQLHVIKHIIKGDKAVFEKLFLELFPKLYRFAYDFVKDQEIAKDLVHETFIKLWEQRLTLDPESNLDSFLFTVCRNKCLNFLKHKKVILHFKENSTSNQSEIELLSVVLAETIINNLDFNLLKDKIDTAIQHLPEQCRLVFELSRFKKKKYSEIATTLNISQKTVEAHISLALRKLKQELKEFL